MKSEESLTAPFTLNTPVPRTGLGVTGHEDEQAGSGGSDRKKNLEQRYSVNQELAGSEDERSSFSVLRDNLWEGFTVPVTF